MNLSAEDQKRIRDIAGRHGATNIRIFGSVARGLETAGSDLDVLVHMPPGRTLLDLIAIKQDLEDALGRSVDVVTDSSLSPHVRDSVLEDAVRL